MVDLLQTQLLLVVLLTPEESSVALELLHWYPTLNSRLSRAVNTSLLQFVGALAFGAVITSYP